VRVGGLTWTQDAWDQMLANADRAAEDYARSWPRVMAVRYDRKSMMVVLELSNEAQLAIPADKLQGVATASEAARSDVRVLGPNWAIEFPKIDEQFTVESLLTGVFGKRQWMIGLTKAAGRAKSPRRGSAIRANGRKETRPKKFVTA
jgi:uncharacterized protein DUF2442